MTRSIWPACAHLDLRCSVTHLWRVELDLLPPAGRIKAVELG